VATDTLTVDAGIPFIGQMPGPIFVDATHWLEPGTADLSSSIGPAGMKATADGGKTWTVVSPSGPNDSAFQSCFSIDGQNGAAVALDFPAIVKYEFPPLRNAYQTRGSLYLTWDGGKTWQLAHFSAD
jgi:photosystem II stability/assembly factor-like uncharacterized protein